MNRSTPGIPVHHQLLEFTQTHVHRVGDAIQPSHPLWNLLYTAFHSNLVSEGFRKPDVRQALWVGAGEEQKESLACAQSRPTAKRATVQLKCPILQEVSKIIRLG